MTPLDDAPAAIEPVPAAAPIARPLPEDLPIPGVPRGPPLGARLLDGLLASCLGAGVLLVVVGVGVGLATADVAFQSRDTPIFASWFVGWVAGSFFGFRRPIAGYRSLALRAVGVALLGGAIALAVGFPVHAISEMSKDGAWMDALAGLALIAVWLRGKGHLRGPRARATLAALGAAAVLVGLVASWEGRCFVGHGFSCEQLVSRCDQERDVKCVVAWGRRGCDRGDAASCLAAAEELRRPKALSPARVRLGTFDVAASEQLSRRACILDQRRCGGIDRMEAEDGCAAQKSFACLELSRKLQSESASGAEAARRKACLLGLDEACR